MAASNARGYEKITERLMYTSDIGDIDTDLLQLR